MVQRFPLDQIIHKIPFSNLFNSMFLVLILRGSQIIMFKCNLEITIMHLSIILNQEMHCRGKKKLIKAIGQIFMIFLKVQIMI